LSELAPIKTPFAQQWKRIRYQLVPVITLAIAMAGTAWLWSHNASPRSGKGEVFTLKFNAVSHRAGTLVQLPGKPLELFDKVDEGDLVALFDDRPVLAELATLQSDVRRLELELPGNQTPVQLSERNKLSVRIESLRINVLDRKAQIEIDRIEQARTQFAATPTTRPGGDPAKALRLSEAAVADLRKQLTGALEQLRAMAVNPADSIENFLAPIRAQLSTHEAKFQTILVHAQSLRVIAPIAGHVIAIHRRPGQGVQAGEQIAVIASNTGQQVVTYVRQQQRVTPQYGMTVEIRDRDGSFNRTPLVTTIKHVGPQYEPVPPQQLSDPKVPEWGVPVMIDLPPGVTFPPGKIVDVKFIPTSVVSAPAVGG
jgi:multidrug resistance efflux pump